MADIRNQLWGWGLGTSLLKEDTVAPWAHFQVQVSFSPGSMSFPHLSWAKHSKHSGDLRVSYLVRCFLHCLTSSWNSPSEKYPDPEPTRIKKRDKITDAISTGIKESPV